MLGIIILVIINVFGNITTTNQQDYSLVKNTAEAAMYDAIDWTSYRTGFYVCHKGTLQSENGKLVVKNKDDYKIVLNRLDLDLSKDANGLTCSDLVKGEYKISADVFTESFLRRFAANVNNNKSYQITVQDVIEYPPKVSVRIDTYSTFNSRASQTLDFDSGDFGIRNQVDAIFEEINNG